MQTEADDVLRSPEAGQRVIRGDEQTLATSLLSPGAKPEVAPILASMRSIRDLASGEAVRHLKYIPRIMLRVRNWPQFLATYMRLSTRVARYRLRHGNLLVLTTAPVDTSTIAVVFIKEDYGQIAPGATVIDIGANIGVFTLYAAASPGTHVFAYEPVDATYRQLQENIRVNSLQDRVTAHKLGVTGARERRAITISAEGSPFSSLFGDSLKTQEIECVGLEDVFEENGIEHCDVLKLDCEGAEFEILYNAPEHILGRVGRMCIEYHDQPGRLDLTGAALVRFLEARGFQCTTDFDPTTTSDTIDVRRVSTPTTGNGTRHGALRNWTA
jgi:FkbM family methyltransferase